MFPDRLHHNLLHFDIFKEDTSLHDFSTTCEGGFSQGNYSSFNLGEHAGDKHEDVLKNRILLSSMLGVEPRRLLIPYQTHEDKIVCIDKDFLSLTDQSQKEMLYGVDALITGERNVAIGVTTADCVPLLIYDGAKGVVAAVHAGWRGTVAGIAKKTVQQMVSVYGCSPADMKAGIAPAISQQCFEVGEEVAEAFDKAGFPMADIAVLNLQTGKTHIDLPLANKLLLVAAGIAPENIGMSGICTYASPGRFFSARRQGIRSGRMLTGAVLR